VKQWGQTDNQVVRVSGVGSVTTALMNSIDQDYNC